MIRPVPRRFGAAFLCMLALATAPAGAAPLVAFSDTALSAAAVPLSDKAVNWAVAWTQDRATTGVSLAAVLVHSTLLPAASVNWFVTTRIGPGTTAADVLYAGSAGVPVAAPGVLADLDTAPRTLLGAGLDFAAGTYYLVLDGPDGGDVASPVSWGGDIDASVSILLDSGFSVGDYLAATVTADFAPAGRFELAPSGAKYAFELSGEAATVPAPATLALVLAGLGAALACRRRGPRT